MNDVILRMLALHGCRRGRDDPRALRETVQQIALLGLWRSRFFERAALCGGAALRLLHGLERFETDLDFTLLTAAPGFDFSRYGEALTREIRALGLKATMTRRTFHRASPLASAFLKADTLQYQLLVKALPDTPRERHNNPPVRLRIEIDTEPPPGLTTATLRCPWPIPFSVRTLALPDELAVKLHALLCRRYYRRAKGRDWYDLVWFAQNAPEVNRARLAGRLRRSGQLSEAEPLTAETLRKLAAGVINIVDVNEARREVAPFLKDAGALAAWSPGFFREIFASIRFSPG